MNGIGVFCVYSCKYYYSYKNQDRIGSFEGISSMAMEEVVADTILFVIISGEYTICV